MLEGTCAIASEAKHRSRRARRPILTIMGKTFSLQEYKLAKLEHFFSKKRRIRRLRGPLFVSDIRTFIRFPVSILAAAVLIRSLFVAELRFFRLISLLIVVHVQEIGLLDSQVFAAIVHFLSPM